MSSGILEQFFFLAYDPLKPSNIYLITVYDLSVGMSWEQFHCFMQGFFGFLEAWSGGKQNCNHQNILFGKIRENRAQELFIFITSDECKSRCFCYFVIHFVVDKLTFFPIVCNASSSANILMLSQKTKARKEYRPWNLLMTPWPDPPPPLYTFELFQNLIFRFLAFICMQKLLTSAKFSALFEGLLMSELSWN